MTLALFTGACSTDSSVGQAGGGAREILGASAGGSTPLPQDPKVRLGTLDNGLTYYLRRNDRPGGRVELRLAVDAGSLLEEADQSGVAHFLEHMLFNGTTKYPANELVKVLEGFGFEFGADINAYTSFDETVYQLSVPTDDDEIVGTAVDVLSEWLSSATIAEDEVVRERGVVLDEWRQSEESSGGRIYGAIKELFLEGTGYADRDPIGTAEAIESMTAERVRRFYDAWYRPDNAAVVMVGDLSLDKMESLVRDAFDDATGRGVVPARPEDPYSVSREPRAVVHLDPDFPTAFAELTLPLVRRVEDEPTTEWYRDRLYSEAAVSILAQRLTDDISRGDSSFIEASVDSNEIARPMDAPSVLIDTAPEELDAAVEALLVELERVLRDGFQTDEFDRAIDAQRAAAEATRDSASTQSDFEFADGYVSSFLTDAPVITAGDEFDVVSGILDEETPAKLLAHLTARHEASAPHVLVVGPQGSAPDVPTAESILVSVEQVAERDVTPRPADASSGIESLFDVRPAPVDESAERPFASDESTYIDANELVFPNGARVILNPTDIADDYVTLWAASPGGLSLVSDADVPAAMAATEVALGSGLGTIDKVELDRILSDSTVDAGAYLDLVSENLYATSSAADLEEMLQVIHLLITTPRFDEQALDSWRSGIAPYVDAPGSDPGLATSIALSDARYGDEVRFRQLPTADDLETIDTATMARVWADRFGDASDWVFVLGGDFEREDAVELARSYLGTLPGDDRDEQWIDLQPDPPAGIELRTVEAGTGDRATLALLYGAPAIDELDDIYADLLSIVATTRLTDHVREQLGASYAPFASAMVSTVPDEIVETYVEITGSSARIDELAEIVQADLEALRSGGPSNDEFQAASEQLGGTYELIDDDAIVGALLFEALGLGAGFEPYATRSERLDRVELDGFSSFVRRALPADSYIQVTTTPA
jgi:zinc protease